MLDEAAVDGTSLRLLARDGRCAVRAGDTELALGIDAPCFFLRRSGELQVFRYPDAGAARVTIAAGRTAGEATRKAWNLPGDEVCGEQKRGIFMKDGALRVSGSVRSGGVYCRDKGVDEKEFWSVAHGR